MTCVHCESDAVVDPGTTGKDLQDADEYISEYSDGSVILCTDGYTIYEDIEEVEGVDGHLAVTHSDTYVIGDAHTNTCENRHSFLRQWLAEFRGVSKHHLQKYVGFLALKLNSLAEDGTSRRRRSRQECPICRHGVSCRMVALQNCLQFVRPIQ